MSVDVKLQQARSPRERPSGVVQYPLAQTFWPSLGAAIVMDQSGQRMGIFPIDFLQRGHVSTVSFIQFVLRATFEEEGILQSHTGVAAPPDEEIAARTYTYVRKGECQNAA